MTDELWNEIIYSVSTGFVACVDICRTFVEPPLGLAMLLPISHLQLPRVIFSEGSPWFTHKHVYNHFVGSKSDCCVLAFCIKVRLPFRQLGVIAAVKGSY